MHARPAFRTLIRAVLGASLMFLPCIGSAQDSAPASSAFQSAMHAYQLRDYRRAIQLWWPLAQQGNPAAQYNVGRMYARGEGVNRDLSEAYKWFALAGVAGQKEGERARLALSRTMTPTQMAEGLRRAEEWRRARRR